MTPFPWQALTHFNNKENEKVDIINNSFESCIVVFAFGGFYRMVLRSFCSPFLHFTHIMSFHWICSLFEHVLTA